MSKKLLILVIHVLSVAGIDYRNRIAIYRVSKIPFLCISHMIAFNGIIDMEYSSGNYLEAIEISDVIITEISSGILLPDASNNNEETIKKIKALSPKYCRITKMEMLDLEILTNWDIYDNDEDNNWRKKMRDKMEAFYQDAINQDGNAYFDKLLIEYYKVIFDILISSIPVSLLDYMRHFVTWFSNPQQPCGNSIYDGYIMWNFNDIKDAIHQVSSPELCKKKGGFVRYNSLCYLF